MLSAIHPRTRASIHPRRAVKANEHPYCCLISSDGVRSGVSWGQFLTCTHWRADHGSQPSLDTADVPRGPATLGEAGEGLPASPLGPRVRARLCTGVVGSSRRMLVPIAPVLQGQPLPGQSWRQLSFWSLCRHTVGGGAPASPLH